MTEKRTRRPDEAQSEKPARERHRIKRRRVDEVPHESKKPTDEAIEKALENSAEKAIDTPTERSSKTALQSPKTKSPKKKEKNAVAKADKTAVGKPTQEQAIVQKKELNGWRLSPKTGGRLLDLDPVFSRDENHIILGLESAVQVYSMSTSRAIRALPSSDGTRISSCVLSQVDDEIAYVSTSGGEVTEWNWMTGQSQRTMLLLGSALLAIRVGQGHAQAVEDEDIIRETAVFALVRRSGGKREISINSFNPSGKHSSRQSPGRHSVILSTSTPINDFRLAAGGAVIVAVASSILVIGQRTGGDAESELYTWHEVRLPVTPTCFDIREPDETSSTTKEDRKTVIDMAVGQDEGAIIVYNDVLNTLQGLENHKMAEPGLSSHKLHWHRGPVKTVRWSKDGNYLISGGLETVLVLWQLDTGRKQFLPHLSSPICNIVVSPKGSSYAVKLHDNSAMVLTTSELKPVASMNGLQIPAGASAELAESRRQKRKGSEANLLAGRLSALVHPLYNNHLLLTVSTSAGRDTPVSSYLQTFDMRSNQQVYRQALARTNVSVLNIGPQGTLLTTPDIKFIRISADGAWLASIDEWQQYPDEVKVLYPSVEQRDREPRREVCLKFWRWNEHSAEWELVSRVNSPHTATSGDAVTVLDLATHPQGYMFASIASDGFVRIWAPDNKSSRKMNSRGAGSVQVKSWRCLHAIPLETPPSQPAASLSFSEDGSALAVCWSSASRGGVVHLVDPESGRIHFSRQGLYTDSPQGCGFLDRHLVIVSDAVCVWDTVSDRVLSCIRLGAVKGKFQSFLAINPRSRTFATCLSRASVEHGSQTSKTEKEAKHQLAVFGLESPSPIFQSPLEHGPLALLSDTKTGEYIIIDSSACIFRMTSGAASFQPDLTFAESSLPLKSGLEDIFGSYRLLSKGATDQPPEGQAMTGVEKKSLADVFDIGPSFALPSVDTLFKNVVDVFAKG
ncbi:NET1-associated nuclear protein 1 [Microsporum canis]|uniref:WD repeat-containing protein 75 n=1 Tax=Arthroderma otae (strain ATCC MYA-4605 / CBS 113480) TaxID=554155 RepID=C5G067_ARTOC|nr:WD repeat-containing protein 75 [Microsporum canis CBS 113480]EEQ35520.1 WD repeat-containing protein 75 [Microsporum canis CBS 113480]